MAKDAWPVQLKEEENKGRPHHSQQLSHKEEKRGKGRKKEAATGPEGKA